MASGTLDISVGTSGEASAEKAFVIGIVFREMLGIPYELRMVPGDRYRIHAGTRYIELPDVLFSGSEYRQRSTDVIPRAPLPNWSVPLAEYGDTEPNETVPILYGSPGVKVCEDHIHCDVDIFGSIFFMVSRYEETVLPDQDGHGRFPASASLAHKSGFLDRPIVDEYVELLWAMMRSLWPDLERERRRGRIFVTCDVDTPFDGARSSNRRFLRVLGGDLIKRRDLSAANQRIRGFVAHHLGDYSSDENYTFDWYMDTCERYGRRAAFFFIPDHTAGERDGTYELFERRILNLVRKVSDRGHEVGVHGSYNSYRDGVQTAKERQRMITACERSGADPSVRGNRQHYLRWDCEQTPDHLDAAGYEYDTTGGFADAPGFRYGTSHPFPLWSWRKNEPLTIRQHPLVVMEGTVFAPHYMSMGYTEEALSFMCSLKEKSMRLGGDFTLLWHNSHLRTPKDREFFEELIR